MKSLIKYGVWKDKLHEHNLYILIFYVGEKLIPFTIHSLVQFLIIPNNYK